jgi:predicted nucleotidyltransferase
MTEDLKNRILYSEELTDLILTNNVLGIYLGGSRLYNLESPDSDYDIVVIVNNHHLANFNRKHIASIKDYKVHMQINPLTSIVELLKNPIIIPNFNHISFVLDSFVLSEEAILYSTLEFKSLLNIFNTNKQCLSVLVLEKILNNLTNRVIKPIKKYHKLYYRILFTYYLLQNCVTDNYLGFTEIQKDILVHMKTNHILPIQVYEVIENLKPHNFYSCKYSYDSIYQEVKDYEQKDLYL